MLHSHWCDRGHRDPIDSHETLVADHPTGGDGMDTIYDHTVQYGGGTFDAKTLQPVERRDGYAVAVCTGTAAIVALCAPGMLPAICSAVAAEFMTDYVGTWFHDHAIHVDPVTILSDRDLAMQFGRIYEQQAIYSFATGQELPVTPLVEMAVTA